MCTFGIFFDLFYSKLFQKVHQIVHFYIHFHQTSNPSFTFGLFQFSGKCFFFSWKIWIFFVKKLIFLELFFHNFWLNFSTHNWPPHIVIFIFYYFRNRKILKKIWKKFWHFQIFFWTFFSFFLEKNLNFIHFFVSND